MFDGDCAFCQRVLRLAERTVPSLPPVVDGMRGDLQPLGLDRDDATRSVWLVMRDGDRVVHFEGADAVGEVLRRQPSAAHRFAGHLLGIPPIATAAQAGYRVIAANRHRLPGGAAACDVPTPDASGGAAAAA